MWATLREDALKIAIPAVLTALGGYLAALIITPEQLYRKAFGPDPDNYVGVWMGRLGNRYAELQITTQDRSPDKRTTNVYGLLTVGIGKYQRRIPIHGGVDSFVTVAGPWDATHEITVSLDRVLNEIKKPGEQYVKLMPYKGETGASICNVANDPLRMPNAEDCQAVPGSTYFTH